MIIPWQQIDPDTLENMLETFVLREGTDYGEQEISLQEKVTRLKQQLQQGVIVLVWSKLHESVNIVPAHQFSGQQPDS